MDTAQNKTYTLLVADDEVIERQFLQLCLNLPEQGLIVKEALENGRQLLDAFVRCQPNIVLADISMPVMSGLEACRLIRQIDPNVILIINTAYAEFDYARNALHDGIDAFLLKPSDKASILDTIRRLIARRFRHDSPVQQYSLSSPEALLYDNLNKLYTALAGTDPDKIREHCEAVMTLIHCGEWGENTRIILLNIFITINSLLQQNPMLSKVYESISTEEMIRCGQSLDENVLRMMLRSAFRQIVLHLQTARSRRENPIVKVERYLQHNFRAPLTLEDLEKQFYLSGAYISQLYKAEYGISIFARLRSLRLEESRRLLRHTALEIDEIARICGYPNTSYFYRIFKREYALTPGEYRSRPHED